MTTYRTLATPTEIALRREIAVLKAKLSLYEWHERSRSTGMALKPIEMNRPDLPERIQLEKRVELVANINYFGVLSVRVEAKPSTGGRLFASYTAECHKFSRSEAGDLAASLHEDLLNKLADALADGEIS